MFSRDHSSSDARALRVKWPIQCPSAGGAQHGWKILPTCIQTRRTQNASINLQDETITIQENFASRS
jgi:hypothetical protein